VFSINNRLVGGNNPVYIIAEMGINHNGNSDIAMKMVEEASKADTDAVKIQIVYADESYTIDSESYSIFKKNEIKINDWEKIVRLAKELKIDIFATFAQPKAILFAEQLDLPAIKISSSNLTNYPLLKAAARSGKPLLLSTGLSYLSEVDESIRYLEENGSSQIGILHCTSLYPTHPKDVNLLALNTLSKAFPYPIGFSDHTIGSFCAVASVAMGAKIIEKHFTLDKTMEGPEHHFSADPEELVVLVKAIRDAEEALGSYVKRPVADEVPLREKMQRTLVADKEIKEGEILTDAMVIPKRSPAKGLQAKYLDIIVGRRAKKNIPKNSPITFELIC